MGDLFTRLFINFRTSIDGVALAVVAWLLSNGIDLSDANKGKIAGLAALVATAIWKLFSTDPEPPRATS